MEVCMRVLVIVGLLLITLPAVASTRERSVEQIQNDDTRIMFVLALYHHAMDRVCDAVLADDEKDNCVRAHWALWREVDALARRTGIFNRRFHDFCRSFMSEVRDHLLKYQPKGR